MELAAAVLAGGKSKRMGQDKARLVWSGTPILERITQTAAASGLPVMVVGRTRPDDWQGLSSITFISDSVPDEGPLRGLEAALLAAAPRSVLLLGCDMLLLTAEILRWLMTEAAKTLPLAHGTISVNDGQWEPLFSLYFPSCLPLVQRALKEKRRSLHGLIKMGDFAFADIPGHFAAQLANINTPEEFDALSYTSEKP